MKNFHPALGVAKRVPPELTIEPVRVTRRKSPAAQTLQIGVAVDSFHQPFAESVRAILFVDEDIAEISKDGVIGNDARESYLLFSIVESEDERVGKCAFGAFARASLCPVGARKKVNNRVHIEAGSVGADGEFILARLKYFLHGVSLSWVIDSPVIARRALPDEAISVTVLEIALPLAIARARNDD